jgi:gentisate 1,2-dioxygenase
MPDGTPRADYYDDLRRYGFMGGWNRPEPSLWPSPRPRLKPHVWRFAAARAALEEAGGFVPMEMTERRNLILVNPAEGNAYPTVRNLVAAYQMIRPGEHARSHRHTPNALRLVIESTGGCYTVVDGMRLDMVEGDVLLTPNWAWHGHAHDGSATAYWIDFLDVPFIQHMEAMFLEHHPDGFEPVTATAAQSPYRIPTGAALATAVGAVRSVEIAAGVMRTIGLHVLGLAPGAATPRHRSTANSLYAVAVGRAAITIEDAAPVELDQGDVVAVPCWHRHSLTGDTDAVLLRVTDEPLMASLNLLRTEPG